MLHVIGEKFFHKIIKRHYYLYGFLDDSVINYIHFFTLWHNYVIKNVQILSTMVDSLSNESSYVCNVLKKGK